jgi:hypothetical protein
VLAAGTGALGTVPATGASGVRGVSGLAAGAGADCASGWRSVIEITFGLFPSAAFAGVCSSKKSRLDNARKEKLNIGAMACRESRGSASSF